MKIENKQWRVADLIQNLDSIKKPKFQRKKRWVISPKFNKAKKACPSYSEYIKFLYETRNSVDVISFGTIIHSNKQIYVNIDGNNRINAIINFIEQPLYILNEKFNDEIRNLRKFLSMEIINNLSYNTLSKFRRLNDLHSISKYIEKLSRDEYNELEDTLIVVQKKLLFPDESTFTESVYLNINIFSNGNSDDYNNIFTSINTHSSSLSENELLASLLYTQNIEFDTTTNVHNFHIKKEIKKYYNERDVGEVLITSPNDFTKEINIFDFMIGLQNYLSRDEIIPVYNASSLGLIFKIFKIIKNISKINQNSFDNFNFINFTNLMIKMNNILKKIFEKIFTKKLNNKLFGSEFKVFSLITNNNLYFLCISILSLIKLKIEEKDIVKKLHIAILYHIYVIHLTRKSSLDDEDEEDDDDILILKDKDSFKYMSGGSHVDLICKKIYDSEPNYLYKMIDKNIYRKLLNKVIEKNIINKDKESNKRGKRRNLNIIHKTFYSMFFKSKVPYDMINNEFSIEHIIPFSTKFNGELDLDRIGNLFPISLNYNKQRSNKHIGNYKHICNDYYDLFLNKLCTEDEYDKIIYYKTKTKPIMMNNEEYKKLCIKNEKYLIDEILNYLFNS
ncbi:MAG: hypothetical protein CMF62_03670 [Magnetococcales bacterium]|nr:hypothetical protein [Magnetococcales bacterium]|tara:strand:+ start:11727 stop:13580 length:1854 start_codon:yes stop_codon:yes gene_type:complete